MLRSITCLILSTFCLLQSADETPSSFSIDTIYCQPVFNCEPGTEVSYCTQNKSKDRCTSCREGEIQPQLVSSLDKIGAKCFSNTGEEECHSDELIPARELNNSVCGIPCLCNAVNCYYGDDPCRCSLQRDQGCGYNMTMNRITGKCEPCPIHTFKNNTGCGPCYYNEMEWHNAHGKGGVVLLPRPSASYMPQSVTMKTTSETQRITQRPLQSTPLVPRFTNFLTNENTQHSSDPKWFIAFVVMLCLAIIFAVIASVLACFLCRRIRNGRQNTATRTTHTGDGHDLQPTYSSLLATHPDSARGKNKLDENDGLIDTPRCDSRNGNIS
ncbi:hypothetical protein CHS0354_016252 [Potamilus streckersoni]|uniref:TNFR-Cys domain-containing protein n=1 Tax=Potamilus streckersoni TaxID=2493646 RepID=A0AAE0VK99_9BIVA|nr:hypothetical protein CHS0354_016252 [Potamilus streckersoni]